MNVEDLDGQPFAVVLSRLDRTDDDGHMVIVGTALFRERKLFLQRKETDPLVPIPPHAWPRIKPVPENTRHVVDVEYSVQLTVSPIEDDGDLSMCEPLGVKWPDESDT